METDRHRVIATALVAVFLSAAPRAWADFQAGNAAYRNADFATALKELSPLADQGDPKAQYLLGQMYDQGYGVPLDAARAAELMAKSSALNDAEAEAYLGWMYEQGQGVAKDLGSAVQWYQKSAQQHNPFAEFKLGLAYSKGQGVPLDLKAALGWYREAADRGNAWAENNLAVMYERGEGVAQDYSKAMQLLQEAAHRGATVAEANIGWMYERGEGVRQDPGVALEWYRRSAEKNDLCGEYDLGRMLEASKPVEASKWLIDAAIQGNTHAQERLGLIYRDGRGVPASPMIAYALFNLAVTSEASGDHYGAPPDDPVKARDAIKSSLSAPELAAGNQLTESLRKPETFVIALDQASQLAQRGSATPAGLRQ